MLIIAYDISNDKLRTKFSKFLEKYGYRLQYSVFKIKNSNRILNIIIANIEGRFKKKFTTTDSIYIFKICERCEKSIYKYGYAKFEDENAVYLKS